ncbi:-like protein [Phaffia rhodozyma]|uniref:-like protein n=1 Tax=Phaffia rhodozyma TaxID=264483 RepID=A0A0F7SR54_PHARH|nr:-like protein [Phaffia rhodozyma]
MSFTQPLRILARSSVCRKPALPLARCVRSLSTTAPRASTSKIDSIVDNISSLTLLEAADLVSALKTKLNITEIAMPAAAAAAPAAGGAAAAEAEPEEKPKEKTLFNVKLEKFDPAAKAKVIREVKSVMPNMNLVEAKKFVESVPQVLKENLSKEEAEALQKKLVELGCTVALE